MLICLAQETEKDAAAIDDGTDEDLENLGPKLLAVLTALCCTPAGRQKPKGEVKPLGGALAGLRAARRP